MTIAMLMKRRCGDRQQITAKDRPSGFSARAK
jgi:hypothetical protein